VSPWRIPKPEGGYEHLKTCPMPMLPDWTGRLWTYWSALENGIPPCAGGVDEQPSALMTAIRYLGKCVSEFREIRWEREHPKPPEGQAPLPRGVRR
jgi:hypothetical protein